MEKTRRGTVTKLIRVGLGPGKLGGETNADAGHQGYGLVRDESGEEIFFVDSALEEGGFQELEVGQTVCYELEPGPLLRAQRLRAIDWEEANQLDFKERTANTN